MNIPQLCQSFAFITMLGSLTIFGNSCSLKKSSSTKKSSLIQACPEEWIQNLMPGPEKSETPREYFIYEGQRRELKEFDLSWIKKNCNIKPQIVQ